MNEAKKRYQISKKKIQQENIELRIENEVIKRQLFSIRNMMNEILSDDPTSEKEQITRFINNYHAKLTKLEKKCVNCQKLGFYESSFCENCLEKEQEKK
jgi:hypothetical protein